MVILSEWKKAIRELIFFLLILLKKESSYYFLIDAIVHSKNDDFKFQRAQKKIDEKKGNKEISVGSVFD